MKKSQIEHRKKKNSGNVEACFFQQQKELGLHPSILKQARKSGQLNLSGRGMCEVPDVVWNINMMTSEELKDLSLSMSAADEEQWWDYVDLNKLLLASNALKIIPPEIKNLQALVTLDLHDNALDSLPDSIADLQHLQKLDISRNKFEMLPPCIFQLKMLHYFFAQHNELKVLDDDIGNLSFLEELDLSHNKIPELPPCIGFLSRVTVLNVSNNELASLPMEIGDLTALKRLELSTNKITKLPQHIGMLRHLEQLYLLHNKIRSIPPLSECTSLKEVHCGFNCIEELSPEFFEQFVCLKYLDLRDNKISDIPETVSWLQSLEVLHLSNNNLSNLPFTIGTLPHLKILTVDGNPLRSIRRDIVQRGTLHLLKWLQSRIKESPPSGNSRPRSAVDGSRLGSSPEVDKYTLRSTKSLNYSNEGLCSLTQEVIDMAVEAEVTTVDLSKNSLEELCEKMELLMPKLTELNLGFNRLMQLPSFIGISKNLQYLDIRNNRIEDLPLEISNLELLREINFSFNKFQRIPPGLFHLKKLEIVIASNNQIVEIDVEGLSALPVLSVLDLQNNNIQKVPAELGNLKQLRSLLLDGNLFRNPRPAILSRGTGPLLEYLRNQIVVENK